MKVKASNLLAAMNTVKEVSKTNTRHDKSLVMFALGQVIAENGQCYIATSRFDHGLPECILPYDKLNDLLSAFNLEEPITLEEKGGNVHFYFKKGKKKSSTKMALFLDNTFNYIHPPDDGWQALPSGFIEGLKKCSISLPSESLNPALTSYGIKDNAIVTSDDFRASQFIMDTGFDQDFIISGAVGQIVINNDFTEYILEKDKIMFRSDSVFAVALLGIHEYPNLNKEIFSYDDYLEMKKENVTDSVERASLFADGLSEIDYAIIFTIDDRALRLDAKNAYGANEEIVDLINRSCEKKILSINPVYLHAVLKILKAENIKIGVTDEDGLVFREKGFRHLIASYVK